MGSIAFKRLICYTFISLLLTAGWQAHAGMVGTEQLASELTTRQQRDQLYDFLSREDVASQLVDLGVEPNQAQERVASLTDAEVATLVAKLEELPAGGSALGTVAMVLLILILLDVAGVTDIFPGV